MATKPSSRKPRSSTPPARRSATSSVRSAVSGHEQDLAGLALIVAGLVFALGIYGSFAGPVGNGLGWLAGGLFGLARFALPVGLAAVGIALIRDARSTRRLRLVLGCTVAVLAVLGLLHVLRGSTNAVAYGDVKPAGGWIGEIIGEPLRSVLATAGSVVLFIALIVAGVALATHTSVRAMAGRAASGARSAGRAAAVGMKPVFGAARQKMDDISTLASDRSASDGSDGTDATTSSGVYDADDEHDASEVPTLPPPAARIYNAADEDPEPGRLRPPGTLPPPDPAALGLPAGQLAIDLGPGVQKGKWRLPPTNLLSRTGTQEVDGAEVEARGHELERALASHGVETHLAGMTVGPTVTRYELELGPGVKVARVTSLHKDIAYAMASADVRILAPIPGRSAIGVEVPNQTRHLVSLGDILGSPEAKAAKHPLDVAVGRDIAGRAVMMNLGTMPHLLVAGATGAGKSSCINCIVTSLLMRSKPDQVRLILVDPKRVEMGQYNRLPHLLTQVVTSPKKAANALQWAVKEMERRYDVLHEVGVRDVGGYNAAYDRGDLRPEPGRDTQYERLPYIVVMIDELNDLMMVAARDVEDSITRLAQMARAVGIHLVIATQRPSVNVITGVIKANIPARMSFAVSSLADSRVILDQPGAERLVGRGDLLLLGPASSVAQRIQGAWVSEEEIRSVVAFWRRQANDEDQYVAGIEGSDDAGGPGVFGASGDDADDEVLVRQAMDLVVRSQLGSTSMLQRKLKVGFARAGRIMDLLEQRGVVGPSEGSRARAVLMSVEELDNLQEAERQGA
jgi:S-DNA-T family DNA segregation ATPase FtsK/SpoIIIE